jgi:hypothetical protein
MEKTMKTLVTICAVVTVILVISGLASATVTTITFNGSDIVAPCVTPSTTGIPVVGDGAFSYTDGQIRTYTAVPGVTVGTWTGTGNPVAFNNWLNGLDSEGEGLSGFNLWLQDGASNQAAMWGENISLTDYTSITAFAPAGWSAEVIPCPWGGTFAGSKLIAYTAENSNYYLRQNNVPVGVFGFTANINTVSDYQMWVGAGNASQSDTGVDQLAGVEGGVYFQRAITAVPEPATMSLLAIGALSLIRRKK